MFLKDISIKKIIGAVNAKYLFLKIQCTKRTATKFSRSNYCVLIIPRIATYQFFIQNHCKSDLTLFDQVCLRLLSKCTNLTNSPFVGLEAAIRGVL